MKRIFTLLFFFPIFLYAQEGPDKEVFMVVEEMPQFPGGQDALFKYLAKNIKYPKEDREAGRQGKVIVYFVVEKNGVITNVRIDGGENNTDAMNEEAIRVVSMMPNWSPGVQRGKPVRVSIRLPIRFALVTDEKEKKKKKNKKRK